MKWNKTMTRTALSLAIAALAVAALSALPADALAKKKGVAGGADLPRSTMAPLTAGECERLGGQVYDNPSCKKTGKSCFVSTLNNGDHWLCVNEAG